MNKNKQIQAVKDPENEIPMKMMEQAVVDIAAGFNRLKTSRLSKRAIVLMVQDSAGSTQVTKKQVEQVLDAAADLGKTFLRF